MHRYIGRMQNVEEESTKIKTTRNVFFFLSSHLLMYDAEGIVYGIVRETQQSLGSSILSFLFVFLSLYFLLPEAVFFICSSNNNTTIDDSAIVCILYVIYSVFPFFQMYFVILVHSFVSQLVDWFSLFVWLFAGCTGRKSNNMGCVHDEQRTCTGHAYHLGKG